MAWTDLLPPLPSLKMDAILQEIMVTSRERGWIGFTWDLLSFSTESDTAGEPWRER